MAEISDYAIAAFYRDAPNFLGMSVEFSRRDELTPPIRRALDAVLAQFGADDAVDSEQIANDLFNSWLESGIFTVHSDRFAGDYYRFSSNKWNGVRAEFLSGSELHSFSEAVGPRFYKDVFGGFRGDNPLSRSEQGLLSAPASDRIVTLNHNSIDILEQPIQELVDQLEQDNGVPEYPGTKDRLLGQVKAGRELLRSGNFRAYLLYATIIRALVELIERYKGSAIAMVAASLVDLLVKHALGAQ